MFLLKTVFFFVFMIMFLMVGITNVFAQTSENYSAIHNDVESLKKQMQDIQKTPSWESIISIGAIITASVTAIINYIIHKKQKKDDAYIDYVYDAKKNTYIKLQPLFFQYFELAESASLRIKELSKKMKRASLKKDESWLSKPDDYLMKSMIYRMLAPHAIFKIIQKQLTQFDFEAEPKLKLQYLLAKDLYYTFSSDIMIALDTDPKIDYNADEYDNEKNEEQKSKMLKEESAKYTRQSIFVNNLDKMTENLIQGTYETGYHLITNYEFENKFLIEYQWKEPFDKIFYLFKNFNPIDRPVLWRILLVQYLLYKTLIEIHSLDSKSLNKLTFPKISINKDDFDWRNPQFTCSQKEFDAQIQGAENGLQKILEKYTKQ